MKEYLFFSKRDRKNIVLLSILIVVVATGRLIYSSFKTKKDYLKYTSTISNDTMVNNVKEISISVVDTSSFVPKNKENKTSENKFVPKKENTKAVEPVLVELNSTDSVGLLPLTGIGPVFAGRIIKYRDRLGGFCRKEQLLEVKYFTEEMLVKLEKQICINENKIIKLKINELEFKDILRHPYIDYEMTKIIVNERAKMHYTSIKDFSSRTGITDSLLLVYLGF